MEQMIYALIETSLTMSLIIALVLVFHHFFGDKYAAKWRYYIWFAVLIGLLLPFRPDFEHPLAIKAPVASESVIPAPTADVSDGMSKEIVATTPNQEIATSDFWSVPLIIFSIWLAGFIIFLAYNVWKHYRFLHMIRRWSDPVTDKAILTLFEKEKETMGVASKRIAIHMCAFEISPMLIGFRKPIVLLPNKPIDEEELALILRHELVHYKRKDLWVNTLLLLVTAIHWFNPAVYVMGKAVQNDCEESCDEALLQGADIEKRRRYGEAIIGLIRNKDVRRTALSTNFYGGKRTLKNRLKSIMDTSKKKAGVAALCGVATITAIILSGSIFMNQSSDRAEASAEITAKRAQEIALAEAGGGKVVKYSLDYENGKKFYDVKVVKGNMEYDIDISATDAKVYSFEEKAIKNTATNTGLKVTPEITIEKAKQIAIAKAGGGTVTKATVDYENGKKIYDIQVVNGNAKYEMDVNATDSKISSYEKETVKTAQTPKNNTAQSNTSQKSASQSNTTSQSKATTPKTTTPKANTSSQTKTTTSEISAARAQQIALGQTGGGKVTQSYVDYENGRKVYDIKIINGNTEYDVEIGAADSKVYGFEKEVLRATTPTKPNTSKPSTNTNGATYSDDDDDRYDNDDNDADDKYDNDNDDDDRYDND
ncbi:hypothetical protein HB809_06775 [Listeria booriae]|nr:hypothetical protein [Listeria booriae]MBC1273868.1 hypothetical protein [Listeria booriae]MBC1307399.1 hypothetical protein [Listeria booriae]